MGCVAILVACLIGSARAAGDYPLVLTLEASANIATAAVTSTVTIRVDRLMEESRRKRVTDALTYQRVRQLPLRSSHDSANRHD